MNTFLTKCNIKPIFALAMVQTVYSFLFIMIFSCPSLLLMIHFSNVTRIAYIQVNASTANEFYRWGKYSQPCFTCLKMPNAVSKCYLCRPSKKGRHIDLLLSVSLSVGRSVYQQFPFHFFAEDNHIPMKFGIQVNYGNTSIQVNVDIGYDRKIFNRVLSHGGKTKSSYLQFPFSLLTYILTEGA